jgi:hypothetical protein
MTTLKSILTDAERDERNQLESVVTGGMKSFVEVGNALLTIAEKRLYRETHGSFEPYCQEKWGMSARRAYQLCEASRVMATVNNCSQIKTESQARELAKVPAEQRAEVLAKAGSKPTAKAIREAAKPLLVGDSDHEENNDRGVTHPALQGVDVAKLSSGEIRTNDGAAEVTLLRQPATAGTISDTGLKVIEEAELTIENLKHLIASIKDGSVNCEMVKDYRDQNSTMQRWLHAICAELC